MTVIGEDPLVAQELFKRLGWASWWTGQPDGNDTPDRVYTAVFKVADNKVTHVSSSYPHLELPSLL